MTRLIRWLLASSLAFGLPLAAQVVPTGGAYTWPTVSATGATQYLDLGVAGLNSQYTISESAVGGTPSACTFRVEGSVDTVVWQTINTVQPFSCVSGATVISANTPYRYIRINLLSYTAGTSAGISFGFSSSAAQSSQVAPIFGGYTFYISGGIVYARNNSTLAVDFSGADAGVVIRSAINNIASTCGHLYFTAGVYNINSLVAETATGFTSTYYAIGFPGNAATNQFCQWFVEGDSAPDLRDEFSDPVQTSGVVLNVTAAALSALSGTPMADVIWVRPESGGSGVSGSLSVKNIDVRFPNNQRGNETGIDATQASNVNYDNVIADTAVSGGSLAFPVAGTIGMYGLTSTNSVHEENYFRNAYAIGYDTSFDIESEHTIMLNSYGLNTNYCVNYGVRGATINHASTWVGGGCGEALHGLTIGTNVAAGTQLDWTGFDMEDLSSGIWQPVVYHAKETNVGGSYGHITYSRDLQGVQTVISGGLFDGGGGTGFTTQDQSTTVLQGAAATGPAIPSGSKTTYRVIDNEPATTGGTFPFDATVPNLPAGGFAELRFGQSPVGGQMFNWGFWNVGTANPCNQGFFGVYASNYPLTVDYNNNIGIGVGLGTCATSPLQVVGQAEANLVKLDSTAQPTCNAANAGVINYVQGNSTTKDTVSVCAHDATNTYAWRTIY